jgi:sulfate adenylyltransferase small subunit
MLKYSLSHLKQLESEAIFVIREVVAQFERPVMLFSGGKDSIVMTRLAEKAFWPSRIPFPLLHIDTGHNFEETIVYRDDLVRKLGVELVVGSVQESIDSGRAREEKGPQASRNVLQTITLLDTIERYKFDAAFGGGRRDEEKARAKERFFSHRDEFGQWDPKNQRPELWNLFNGKKHIGEHFRIFPLSNWTEMDVWQYIAAENIEIPTIYYLPPPRRVPARRRIPGPFALHHPARRRKGGKHGDPLPHGGRHDLYRRGDLQRLDVGGHHRRGGRRPGDGAWRPGRRQTLGGRHGGPQKGRIFLVKGP